MFANEFVRFFLVEIAAIERTMCHRHAHDYLMYVMGDAEIVSAPRDGEPKTHAYHDGDCEVSPAGLVHVVENLRETKFRNLLVELLPGLGELRRGSDPRIAAGDGVVEAIFEEKRISVWSVETKPGMDVEACGPAIAAFLFEEPILPKHPSDITDKAANIRDLTWIQSDRALLGGFPLDVATRAIVFQLGCTEKQLAAVQKRADEPLKSLRTHARQPE